MIGMNSKIYNLTYFKDYMHSHPGPPLWSIVFIPPAPPDILPGSLSASLVTESRITESGT